MPVGSFSYQYPGGGLGLQASLVATFLYTPAGYSWLPNVQCQQVQWHEGKTPRTAQFRYILDSSGLTGFPSQFEDLWPLVIPGGSDDYTLTSTDRIVVFVQTPDGTSWPVFDGFPRLPQTDYGSDQQQVTFLAIGVETRASDNVISGRWQEDIAPIASVGLLQCKRTDISTKFNPTDSIHPYGLPNCTHDGADQQNDNPSVSYPVFSDELSPTVGLSPTMWTLGKAVRYILGVYNTNAWPDGTARRTPFVTNPDFTQTDTLLDNLAPLPGQKFFDPTDPNTFVANPIILREIDLTNMPWPDALEQLLGFYNFGFRWMLGLDKNLNPQTTVQIYRKDPGNTITPKDLFLQESPATFDPSQTNVGNMSASFDYHGVVNAFRIETHPILYEVSLILAPGFTPSSGDYQAPARNQFLKENLDNASQTVRDKYRLYVFDENGVGHWDFAKQQIVTGVPTDLSILFPPTQQGNPTYVVRARQCKDRLITTDTYGEKYRTQLAFTRNTNADGTAYSLLFNFPGPAPAVAIPMIDQVGWNELPWQPIPQGSWDLEDDRIGIRFTCKNPDEIPIGDYTESFPQESSKVLQGIRSISDPTPQGEAPPSTQLFILRLTTVIEADHGLDVVAGPRQASPLANLVLRRLDAKDVFQKQVIIYQSAYWETAQTNLNPMGDAKNMNAPYYDTNNNIVARDDTNAAQAYANQMRTAHEMPAMPMAVTVPYFTTSYLVGDRIDQIQGRDVSLQTNAGNEQGEAPAYPFIVSVTWRFEGDSQTTAMQLTDHRLSPQALTWSGRRPGKG